jgi:hypothetical protein
MRFRDRTVKSVSALLDALKDQAVDRQPIWFRGQSFKEWALVPSLARKADHLKAENALIKRFVQNATPNLTAQPQHEWEWMFLMQHHRAPTRLLDWTESPLVAMYFAVVSGERAPDAGTVWCLDPIALNKEARLKFEFDQEIPALGIDKVCDSYLPSHVHENPSELFPIAVVGPRNTPRMVAQLGTFTLNHRMHTPLEKIWERKHVW